MTESEWLKATDPEPMLDYVCGRASERKHHHFACACCRSAWDRLSSSAQAVVEVTERYIDGLVSVAVLDDACESGFARITGSYSLFDLAAASTAVSTAVHASCMAMRRMAAAVEYDHALWKRVLRRKHIRSQIARNHCALLRCIFGNPFRPVDLAPWRSETAVALAAGIYADRAFDRLPILADALEEAGCDHADVLTHCRQPGPHARGCWVVDGVLGKG